MNVPDLIFTIGGFVNAGALLPSVFSKKDKPAVWTSILTAGTLYTFAGTFLYLGFLSSSISMASSAILWTILLAQKLRAHPVGIVDGRDHAHLSWKCGECGEELFSVCNCPPKNKPRTVATLIRSKARL